MVKRIAPVAVCLCLCLLPGNAAASVVKRWGRDAEGPSERSPALISGISEPALIQASNASSYVIQANGVLKAFGDGAQGALGDDTTESSESGVTVDLTAGFKPVALGQADQAGYAINSAGEVESWGYNYKGDLCLGATASHSHIVRRPEKIVGLSGVIAAAGGAGHIVFLMANGTVEVCGDNNFGQLGLGSSVTHVATPTVVPGLDKVVQVSAGPDVSAALRSNGEVLTWGANEYGESGQGSSESHVYTPTHLSLPGPASQISLGGGPKTDNAHSEALVEGVAYGWGVDEDGEIGDDSTIDKDTPVVASELSLLDIRNISTAGSETVVLTRTGEVYALGAAPLGSGSGKFSLSPVFVNNEGLEVSATAANKLELDEQ